MTGRPTAWLSLDAGDNDPAVFWTYVVAALQRGRAAGRHRRADACCNQRNRSTSVVDACSTTWTSSTDRVVLVLDDYHVIESTDIHESIAFLLEHAPPHVPPRDRQPGRPAAAAWPLAGPRANCSRSAPPTCASPTTRQRRTSTTRWGCSSPPATSTRSRPAPRGGSPRCNSPRCRCRAATTSPVHRRTSPATTASSSTTSSRRCSTASPNRSDRSCCRPRCSTG